MVFFCLLREDLLSSSLKFLDQQMMKQMEESLTMIEQAIALQGNMDGGTSLRN
jgi:hypothetical protein